MLCGTVLGIWLNDSICAGRDKRESQKMDILPPDTLNMASEDAKYMLVLCSAFVN